MKKKKLLTVLSVIVGIGLLFAMKSYVDSYSNNSEPSSLEDKDEKKDNDKKSIGDNANIKEKSKEEGEKGNGNKGYNETTNFKLTDIEGNEISLSDYAGKKVFINFWASWCGYCVAEMPDIQKLYEEVNPEEIAILTINVGEKLNTIEKFIEGKGFTFPILQDSDIEVSSKYNAISLPMSILLDRNGNPIHVARGMLTYEQMTEFVSGEISDYE